MKSKSFEEFYNKAMIIAKIIKENYRENAINTKLVENFTDITECFTLGKLPQIIKQELMSNSKTLQISFGNLVKNIAKHSEVDFLMFKKVIEYLKSAENHYKDKDKIIFEKIINNNFYQIIVKTTKNKKENYLLSFYKANHKKR